ncbi:MAG: A/G-specific adenine glycosylase [Ruminococcaceae bacterium]|nr:A/G-specific adenine glycosylase [Oscillospiraceae bacterium]
MERTILQQLPGTLLPWYGANKRDLPWRQDRDPYHIWLSEIMLQQTRVEAVKGYYARFLSALPNVEALASCDDDALHKLWEGLGYYSRVRNLKKAARVIMTDYAGHFPTQHPDILALPGIGEYTAGAICSIAFDQPRAAVDGNVLRVISRILDDATPIDQTAFKTAVRVALEDIYPAQAGDFTQALMELGATVCGPNRQPDCDNCPCQAFCLGYRNGTAKQLPVKSPKKQRKTEDMTVFVLSCDGKYAIEKRPNTGLLADLWQFPNLPGHLEPQEALAAAEQWGLRPRTLHRQVLCKHIFTHIQWQMLGYYLEVAEPTGDFVWMTTDEINATAALPTAFRQFWEEIFHV